MNPKQKAEVRDLVKKVKTKTLEKIQEPSELAQAIGELSAFIALNKDYGEFQKFREVIYDD